MATINKVVKQVLLNRKDIIQFQLLTHCFLRGDPMNAGELECLTLLAENGEQELSGFCKLVNEHHIYASSQSARNALTKLEKKKYVVRTGRRRKYVKLHPDIQLQTEGNIFLDYQFAHESL